MLGEGEINFTHNISHNNTPYVDCKKLKLRMNTYATFLSRQFTLNTTSDKNKTDFTHKKNGLKIMTVTQNGNWFQQQQQQQH